MAFSGDIEIKGLADLPFNERNMNPGLHGLDIKEALDTRDYRILLVANKYQTGFDQPKLVAMYVDKKLSGVATVQTLSRLNRTYKRGDVEKDWTAVLDFMNDPASILVDFQKYYSAASLPTGTDPNLIYSLESKLDAAGIYLESEVDAFASFYWDPKRKKDSHFQLQKYLGLPCDRFKQQYLTALNEDNSEAKDTMEIFAKDIGSFTKLFEFISQIYDFAGDAALEKRYSFFKELSPILWNIIREGRDSQVIDLSDVRLSHYAIHPSGKGIGSLEPDTTAEFEPAYGAIGSAASHDP